MTTCDGKHAAPTCDDPACYREEVARRADDNLPGLGELVRKGLLDPDPRPDPQPDPDPDTATEDAEQWTDAATLVPPLRAFRAADPSDPATTDRLTDEELTDWATKCGIYEKSMEGTYLRFLVDELQDRRAAEEAFAEVDERFQALECEACDDLSGPRLCSEHEVLAKEWRRTRENLLEQVRIHRGYLLDLMKGVLGKVPE